MSELGGLIIDGLFKLRASAKQYDLEHVLDCYEKLPTYIDTGKRFVPGIDEWYSVVLAGDKWIVWNHINTYAEHFGNAGWMPSDCGGSSKSFAGFYSTRSAAQAEADRLNEQANDDRAPQDN